MGFFTVKMSEQIGCIRVIRNGTCGHFCLSIAAQIIANNTVMLGKNIELLVPHPAVSDSSMDQEKWMARTCDFIVQTCSLVPEETSFFLLCFHKDLQQIGQISICFEHMSICFPDPPVLCHYRFENTPPIYEISQMNPATRGADKSAVGAINRPLRRLRHPWGYPS